LDDQSNSSVKSTWYEAVTVFADKRAITMFFLGFSAGLPILMIFSSLSLWLREAGVEKSSVTYFSWAALGYSFKFIWAPLVDKLPLPFLTKTFGRRRGWLLFSQLLVIIAMSWMALVNPAAGGNSLTYMALAAVMLGFSSATQDIVIDAYRIESAESEMQAICSATYIAGYRVAMIVSGAGALYLASYLGTTMQEYNYSAWKWTYLVMACFMLVGITTTLLRPEPESKTQDYTYSAIDYTKFFVLFLIIAGSFVFVFFSTADIAKSMHASIYELLGNKALSSFIVGLFKLLGALIVAGAFAILLGKSGFVNKKLINDGYVDPLKSFFDSYGTKMAITLLALVGLYRISDIVLGVISNVFYQDLEFTKIEIANVVKTFGLIMTIIGGFIGGIFTKRYGVYKILFWGAVLSSLTNLLFMAFAYMGKSYPMLYLVISADNLAAGLASAAFIAFLSSLTDIRFTAVQYAIFSSLMTLFPKIIGGYSGSMVKEIGYPGFFLITTIIGLPVLYIVWLCKKNIKLNEF
jgi:MFS transporter, PAT family, beta-lactamase induction signal transducer AmpG